MLAQIYTITILSKCLLFSVAQRTIWREEGKKTIVGRWTFPREMREKWNSIVKLFQTSVKKKPVQFDKSPLLFGKLHIKQVWSLGS